MKRVGIFDAKTNLSGLVDEVEKGEEIIITRHGKPVAKLVQAQKGALVDELERRRRAIKRIREIARELKIKATHDEIKGWINEGRH